MDLPAQVKTHIEQGALERALALMADAPLADPGRVGATRLLAPALLAAGRADEAAACLDTAAALQPNLPWLLQLQIEAATARGDREVRLVHLRRAFELQPSSTSAYAALHAALTEGASAEAAAAVAQEHAAHVCFAMNRLAPWQEPTAEPEEAADARTCRLYLDLLERTVSNWIYGDAANLFGRAQPFEPERRRLGKDIPEQAHTMIGLRRLRHLRVVVEDVLRKGIPGDLIEAGVWRGGACILMAGVLEAWGDTQRKVIAADSFAGLPPPDSRYAKDALTTFNFHLRPELAVGAAQVQANFERYGLWGPRVMLLEGLFCDTLPACPSPSIAVLRMDGDLYSSTMDTLVHLYDRVSPGGYVISDDYGVVIDARRAVLDFRAQRGITAEMIRIDDDAVYWRKPA
jgi:O-methyltransferase